MEYIPGKQNPMADALNRKCGSVSSLQTLSVLTIDGMEMELMKDEYPDSDEFGTAYGLALTAEPGHYSIQDGWLLYKSRLCVTSTFQAAVLHDAHDSLVGGHRGIHNTLEKLERHFFWPRMRHDVYKYVQQC